MTPDEPDTVACGRCGTINPRRAFTCANCRSLLPAALVPAEAVRRITIDTSTVDDEDRSQPAQFTLATLMFTVTLCAVCFALFAAAPGLGIGLAIILLPAFVRTLMIVQSRRSFGRKTSAELKIVMFLGSAVTALISSVVVLVASVGTFCGICLSSGSSGSIPVALAVAGAAVIGVFIMLAAWYRSRWRRDLTRRGP